VSAPTKIGVIGCGNISPAYFSNLKKFPCLEVVACADLDKSRAKARAKEFGIPKAMSVGALLKDPEIKLVVNLTIPKAHLAVGLKCLRNGKHTYSEKPFGLTRKEGQKLLAAAAAAKLRVGCAPDTVLGGGIQSCRKLIDDGLIGRPVAATAFMLCHGHEGWHPDPEFYYQPGGGPMFDMGPYYLTALITLMGPVKRVAGSTAITFPERTIRSQPKNGTVIKVEVPTHVAGLLEFHNGAVATLVTSFDVWHHHMPNIEVYGAEGSISVPDPNAFGGPIRVRTHADADWRDMPYSHGYTDNSRGLGVADMVTAINANRVHRQSGELAFHVLDIMQALHESSVKGKFITLGSTCAQPKAMDHSLPAGVLDQ
jgi:predicted dehydrogenase